MTTREREILAAALTSQVTKRQFEQSLSAMREYAMEMSIGFINFWEENKFRKYTKENLSDNQLYNLYLESINNK